MRTRQIIPGLNNSQRIRVILNGVGFYTTVKGGCELPFSTQRSAVLSALISLAGGKEKSTGFGTRVSVYNHKMERESFDVQVDLV
jgi:hypothetical protein